MAYGHYPLQKLCFSGRIRTLVAMVTYSFHRLIMEKWKLAVSVVSLGIFDFFKEIFIEKSSIFPMTFVQIA